MVRHTFSALLILLAASGCGRSTPYTYPPGTVQPGTPDPIRLPDGGFIRADAGTVLTCRPVESDFFTLPPKTKKPIDVLFVIDDSASMKNDQEAVAANFKSFISSFITNEVDFHLGTVTTDRSEEHTSELQSPC